MKIVCPCRNLRLGKTVHDAENRSLLDDEPALTPEFTENLLALFLLVKLSPCWPLHHTKISVKTYEIIVLCR